MITLFVNLVPKKGVDCSAMSSYLIFGGTGSLGKKLIQRFLSSDDQVTVYSRDEAKHWSIKNELANDPNSKNLKFIVGDIRDYDRVKEAISSNSPDIIIIAAALKQVDTCELSPVESVKTNLSGTENVIKAVLENAKTLRKVYPSKVLFVSTDKACSPVNVYGMCKAVSERIVTSQAQRQHFNLDFLCVRYGNVLESRGSIIPLFKYQAMNNKNLTVTDPEMTRFLMTLDDSVDLIQEALRIGKSGETWIPRLPAMKIGDLAEIFSEDYDKPIKVIGLRPGEKQHEDLINESESTRTRAIGSSHYVIGPAFDAGSGERFTYSSNHDVMTKDQLRAHLNKLGILDMPLNKFTGLTIEEIVTTRGK